MELLRLLRGLGFPIVFFTNPKDPRGTPTQGVTGGGREVASLFDELAAKQENRTLHFHRPLKLQAIVVGPENDVRVTASTLELRPPMAVKRDTRFLIRSVRFADDAAFLTIQVQGENRPRELDLIAAGIVLKSARATFPVAD